MDILEAIRDRASTRAFLDKSVSEETVRGVLETARWSPSGVNSQPWQVAVVGKTVKQKIGDRIVAAMKAGQKAKPDYKYYADRFPGAYRKRQVACGKALYDALGIERDDRERRTEQWVNNYYGFGAPVELFVFVEDFLLGVGII